jgi:hypothetical protein
MKGMRKRYQILLGAGALLMAVRLVYGWWNQDELVTLHGKEIPVTDALKSFSKQTGRTILFPATLDQKVTLHLDRVPLEDALEAVSDQAELQQTRIFLLTSGSKRRTELLEQLAKQTEPPVLMRLGRGSRWMSGGDRPPGLVTYKADGKPVDAVVADLNIAGGGSYFYFSGEYAGPLTLDWKDLPVRSAAEELASRTRTDATRLYQVFGRNREQRNTSGSGSPEGMAKWAEQRNAEIAALPPAEKAAAEEQWKQQQERMKEFAAMPEEQRIDRAMQRFVGGNQEERLIERLKKSTPESRAKRYQRMEARRKSRGSGTPAPANPKPAPPATP